MTTLVRRDPFARTELHRRNASTYPNETRAWCGQRSKHQRLYTYETQSDGGRTHPHRGAFCSVSCHDSYHS